MKRGRDHVAVDEFMSRFSPDKCNWTRLLRNYEIFMNYMQFGNVTTITITQKKAALIWHEIVSIIIADGCCRLPPLPLPAFRFPLSVAAGC